LAIKIAKKPEVMKLFQAISSIYLMFCWIL
jgi:hypothetical protein